MAQAASRYAATYSGRLVAARLFIGSWQQSCSAEACLFILGRQYLSLGVLRRVFGVRYAVNVLVNKHSC